MKFLFLAKLAWLSAASVWCNWVRDKMKQKSWKKRLALKNLPIQVPPTPASDCNTAAARMVVIVMPVRSADSGIQNCANAIMFKANWKKKRLLIIGPASLVASKLKWISLSSPISVAELETPRLSALLKVFP
eukprot:CAMPEP_0172788022 /NCGR_PEP_ID=MMETSP1074-20121228/206743_1 /TAXON_ID=2916 /ORGANISM="Ceratium fusus, Strain PA161109" /LENGTH=131 /DNA_ID=CAMNT_0013625043 /DNA_START=86 /DNA_END=481 /DNA_ORIENTATION=+